MTWTEDKPFETGQQTQLHKALTVLRFNCSLPGFKTPSARSNKAAPEHTRAILLLHFRHRVPLFVVPFLAQ